MQQIADWLEKLDMSEYAGRFAENRIDFSVLRDLVVLGDRRKILRAISELAGAAPATSQIHAVPSASPEDRAERRQVTVMFSDVVGSTALSARVDPEDLREIISAYQKCVSETVNPSIAHIGLTTHGGLCLLLVSGIAATGRQGPATPNYSK